MIWAWRVCYFKLVYLHGFVSFSPRVHHQKEIQSFKKGKKVDVIKVVYVVMAFKQK